ncbi:MAG: carbohydrate-binding domain-containing protein [Blautia sp.]|nr:carbohydrate-binding domain-containing protein [Blautia sp.]MCM1200155.1 carbohydrate-binding domain-containing protein [Bacteroides fragilis]
MTKKKFFIFPLLFLPILLLPVLLNGMRKGSTGAEPTVVSLQQETIEITGKGAAESGGVITIERSGRYLITGTLQNGRIYVDAGDDGTVLLELGGAVIDNPSRAAIYVENAAHVMILLTAGTENTIRSGAEAGGPSDDGESGAAIYAKKDLFFTGEGSLLVEGGLNNGIQSKAGLQIDSGNIEVNAVNHGIKGKDLVTIAGGSLRIAAGDRGVQAKYEMRITGGNLQITAKEGLEANQISIEGGTVDITAGDDGINANGGEAKQKKDPSEDVVETMPNLTIRGGVLHIDAEGDGLDSNGNICIEGGELVIDGPAGDDDGPIDFGKENGGGCMIRGGTVLAIGSSGMAETFDESSEQCSFRWLFDTPYEAGSEIVITDAAGKELYRHTAARRGASVVFSSPALVLGEDYTLCAGEQIVEIRQKEISVK